MKSKLGIIYPKFTGTDLYLFRVKGDGLGNLMFPWARAVCLSEDYQLKMLPPTWGQIKIGPLLRRERDLRLYFNLFNNDKNCETKLKKFFALNRYKRVSEKEFLLKSHIAKSAIVIEVQGMEGYFDKFIQHHNLIKSRLLQITRNNHKQKIDISAEAISVHVRLGDFQLKDDKSEKNLVDGIDNLQQPLNWYKDAIIALRKEMGSDYPVIIWSDDEDYKLGELLEMPHVRREFLGSSIADLLAMSSSKVLVASGSTFSMWASYLGRQPVLWHQGQLRQRLYYEKAEAEIEVGYGTYSLPQSFVKFLKTET